MNQLNYYNLMEIMQLVQMKEKAKKWQNMQNFSISRKVRTTNINERKVKKTTCIILGGISATNRVKTCLADLSSMEMLVPILRMETDLVWF